MFDFPLLRANLVVSRFWDVLDAELLALLHRKKSRNETESVENSREFGSVFSAPENTLKKYNHVCRWDSFVFSF